MKKVLVAQFAKWPELGKVKTRLAKNLGEEKALAVHIDLMKAVYHNLHEIVLNEDYKSADLTALQSHKFTHELWFNDAKYTDALADQLVGDSTKLAGVNSMFLSVLSSANDMIKSQKGDNLGDKMAYTISSELKSYDKIIIVGSDCPNVTVETLEEASAALDAHDLVIGPAEDGGYVLVGAKRFDNRVFENVSWGSSRVMDQTIKNAKRVGYSVFLLDESWDVDELPDYERWLESKK